LDWIGLDWIGLDWIGLDGSILCLLACRLTCFLKSSLSRNENDREEHPCVVSAVSTLPRKPWLALSSTDIDAALKAPQLPVPILQYTS
jgi:hypothetical protein